MILRSLGLRQALGISVLACVALVGCSQNVSKTPDHGASIIVECDDHQAGTGFREIIARRLDRFGAKASVESISSNQLRVSVSISEPQALSTLTNLLASRGLLEVRVVHENSERLISEGKQSSAPNYEMLEEKRVVRQPAQYQNFVGHPKTISQTTQTVSIPFLVKKSAEISSVRVSQATARNDPMAKTPQILIKLDRDGAAAFAKVTADNVGRQLAIVIDGKLISAPRIIQPITGGSAVLAANFSMREAVALASLIENPSPFPFGVRVEKMY